MAAIFEGDMGMGAYNVPCKTLQYHSTFFLWLQRQLLQLGAAGACIIL